MANSTSALAEAAFDLFFKDGIVPDGQNKTPIKQSVTSDQTGGTQAGSDTFNAKAGNNDVLLMDAQGLQTNIHAGAGIDIVQVIGKRRRDPANAWKRPRD